MRYAETDQMGVVYYANYFVWFEVGAHRPAAHARAGRTARWRRLACFLPVIEAPCEYRRPARYDDEVEIRTAGRLASPVRMEFNYEVRLKGRPDVAAAGRTVHAALDRDGRPCRLPDARPRGLRMKALVTGAAGFIGSHLAGALLDAATTSSALDCFTDYYAARDQGRRTSRRCGRARLPLRRGRAADGRPRRAARRRHARVPSRRAGGRAQELGRRSSATTRRTTSTPRSGCSRPCKARPIERFVYASSSSVYGDAGGDSDARGRRCSQPVSPYGVTKLAAEHLCHLYHVNYGVPAVSLRYFTVYGPRQRPDMAFHRFLRAALTGAAHHDLRRRRADPRLHVRRRRGRGHARPQATADAPAPSITSAGAAASPINEVLELVAGMTGRSLDIRREPPQKGDMRDTFADTTRARADLGFAPAVHARSRA